MRDFKILLKYHSILKPYFFVFFIAILFDVGMTGLGLLNPLFTRILFDYAYPYHSLTLLNVAVLAIVVSYFILFFLSIASDYLQIYVNMETTAKLTEKVYHAIQCLPLNFHQKKKSGDLLVRITDDVDTTIGMVSGVIPTVLIEGGRFIVILFIALTMNPFLTLLALLSIPLYLVETLFYVKRLQQVQQESIDVSSHMYTHVQERLSSIKTIKAFGQEQNETLSFGKLIRRSYRVGIKERLLGIIQAFTNSITLQMWSVFLTWYLGYQVVKGQLTIGEIVALMMYLEQLGGPIHAFIGLFTGWKTAMISVNRLEEILEGPTEASRADDERADLMVPQGDVTAAKLSFAYSEDENVLHDISVSFPEKSMTAIVGGSGSGKSTLVNLLLRFFDASKGAIFIDGQNISEIRIRSLRQHVGMIAQDFSLFDGTVMENILYGNEEKTKENAIEAAKLASAYDFVMRFHKGFDEPVGPGGELLSGGQRQRIAIARTLLKNPEIIIFDEATSALDPESEFKIQEVMNRLARTKTVIAIAHRLSTIKSADKIMVLERGKFVEEGRFDDLIEKRGAFYRFYWRQFGGLANLRQQLGMEFERSVRYGSSFCIALLRVLPYQQIYEEQGEETASKLMSHVEYLLEKNVRMGDNCSILDEDYILVLIPEVNEEQINGFINRVTRLITEAAAEADVPIEEKDLLFVATRLSEKIFRTPEELMGALKFKADSLIDAQGSVLVPPQELLRTYEIGTELSRAARAGTSFSLALLKIETIAKALAEKGADFAKDLMKDVVTLIEKNIRSHDSCSPLEADYVILLTPEYTKEELKGFLSRIIRLITEAPTETVRQTIAPEEIQTVGLCVEEKLPFLPEELIAAIKGWLEGKQPLKEVAIITPDELEQFYGAEQPDEGTEQP